MPRIPRIRGLGLRPLATAPSGASTRTSWVASCTLSTTCAARGKNTDWFRKQLWKDKAPGSEDPYTQRPETEVAASNLPDEALETTPLRDTRPAAVRASGLVLPPKRTEAATEKELESLDPTYVPATDAEGLEQIGATKTWWEQPGHWGRESEFRAFGSAERVVEKDLVELYLRRAVVEVLALQETGAFSQWVAKKWRQGDRSELDQALAVEIHIEDGKASLKGDVSSVSQNLTAEAEDAETPGRMSLDEARQVIKAWDPSWRDLALDGHAKFAVRKRLYQLTGKLIPDSKLGAAKTVKHVLTLAAKEPKPPKLAEVLERRGDLQQLANVKLHGSKIRMIEKETAIGRWKVIEEELKKRDLPVTGTAGLPRNREMDWLLGRK